MVWNYIIAILITCIAVYILSYLVKISKGITLKYGAIGLVLIFLPSALVIAGALTDAWYTKINLIATIIGLTFIIIDLPKS